MNLTQRVEEGLSYRNGSWDTTRYISDPNTPHPSGSNGFSMRKHADAPLTEDFPDADKIQIGYLDFNQVFFSSIQKHSIGGDNN